MSAQNQDSNVDSELSKEDLLATQTFVAGSILRGDRSWEILQELYRLGVSYAATTQSFVYGVKDNLTFLREKLKDPTAFEQSFHTLVHDVTRYLNELNAIREQHAGKSGEPTGEDVALTNDLSQRYSNAMTRFESVIQPLMLSLVDILRQEVPDILVEVKPDEEGE